MRCLKKFCTRSAGLLLLLALFQLPCLPCAAEEKFVITAEQLEKIQTDMRVMMQSVNELESCVEEQSQLLEEREKLVESLRKSSMQYKKQAAAWKNVSAVECSLLLGCAACFITYRALN